MRNQTTVVRDFNGGLNIVDDDLNLNSSFQTLLDNVHRGIDSALTTRYGYTLFADMRDGASAPFNQIDNIVTTDGVTNPADGNRVFLFISAITIQNFEHITFVNPVPIPAAGITLQGTYGIVPAPGVAGVPDGRYLIWHEVKAIASVSTGVIVRPNGFTHDNHMLAGNILEIAYFNDFIVVVDDLGEIASIDRDGTKLRIWSNTNAYLKWEHELREYEMLRPWSRIIYASSDIFKAELIICNGFDGPLIVDFTEDEWNIVKYMGDPGNNFSTVNTPVCRYVRSVGRWLVMAGDAADPFRVHISATDAGSVWEDDLPPNDATHVYVTNIASSSSSVIRGINRFREFCVVGFDDACVLLELGIFDGTDHVPDPVDTIVRHGTIAHKTMVYMGFDLLMADAIGVPGLAKSLYDNTTMPSRHSDFISPVLQRNVSRLSGYALENECFAVFNSHDNRYILFMPDYDDDQIELARDPFVIHAEVPQGRVLVRAERHLLEPGSLVAFSGVTGTIGGIDGAANFNTSAYVVGVISDDWFSIDLPLTFTDIGAGGGTTVIMTRRRSEHTGYAYTYNKNLKIKSWSRYRNMNFVAGCSSVYGRLFLATDSRVWRMGTRAEPIYGDQLNGFELRWRNNTLYNPDQLLLDEAENKTYRCILQHVSLTAGTFEQARATTDKEYWEPFYGHPINFELELPWADFDKRDRLKIIKQLGVDAKGTGRFNVQMFNDYYYKSRIDGTLTPSKEMEMIGGDSGGYGGETIPYGSGRLAIRQRLWPWDMRGKLFKLRVEGSTNEHLSFIAFVMIYGLGGTMR